MKLITFILILFSATICRAQSTDDWYTIRPKHLDSNYKKEIRVIHFKHSSGVIFPASYAQSAFGNQHTYFTPDTNLIKKIEPQIIHQYCNAITKLNVDNLKDLINRTDDKEEIKKYLRAIKEERTRNAKWCSKWKDNVIYFDRQYIGYIFENGERVVRINMIDLRQNIFNLKSVLDVAWIVTPIDGNLPHCETAWFYIDRNLLSINPIN